MERSFDLAPKSPFAHLEFNAHEKSIADMCGIPQSPMGPNTLVFYTEGHGFVWNVDRVRVAWTQADQPLVQLEAHSTSIIVSCGSPTYGEVKNLFAKANRASGSWILVPATRRSNQGPIFLGLAFIYIPYLCAQLDSQDNFQYGTEWFTQYGAKQIDFSNRVVLDPTEASCEDIYPFLGSVCFGNYLSTNSSDAKISRSFSINRLSNLLNVIKNG